MPTASRNARKKARAKRTMSLTKRALREAAFAANRNHSVIMMLLDQAGGEIRIAKATMDRIVPRMASLQFQITPDGEEGAIISTVVPQSELPTETLEQLKARMDAAHNELLSATVVTDASLPEWQNQKGVEAALAREKDQPLPLDPTDAAMDPA
jgi:hypothetical protein